MPKSELGFCSLWNSSWDLFAQRRDISMDFSAYSCVAGYGVHSSSTITMSESSAVWICIETSGERNTLSPFRGLRNVAPSSESFRSSPRLKTWNPPESVRIGRCQFMN